MISAEKQQKYQHYHLQKLININILQEKKILPSNQRHKIKQAQFTYFPLGKAFWKHTKTIKEQRRQQIDAIMN